MTPSHLWCTHVDHCIIWERLNDRRSSIYLHTTVNKIISFLTVFPRMFLAPSTTHLTAAGWSPCIRFSVVLRLLGWMCKQDNGFFTNGSRVGARGFVCLVLCLPVTWSTRGTKQQNKRKLRKWTKGVFQSPVTEKPRKIASVAFGFDPLVNLHRSFAHHRHFRVVLSSP